MAFSITPFLSPPPDTDLGAKIISQGSSARANRRLEKQRLRLQEKRDQASQEYQRAMMEHLAAERERFRQEAGSKAEARKREASGQVMDLLRQGRTEEARAFAEAHGIPFEERPGAMGGGPEGGPGGMPEWSGVPVHVPPPPPAPSPGVQAGGPPPPPPPEMQEGAPPPPPPPGPQAAAPQAPATPRRAAASILPPVPRPRPGPQGQTRVSPEAAAMLRQLSGGRAPGSPMNAQMPVRPGQPSMNAQMPVRPPMAAPGPVYYVNGVAFDPAKARAEHGQIVLKKYGQLHLAFPEDVQPVIRSMVAEAARNPEAASLLEGLTALEGMSQSAQGRKYAFDVLKDLADRQFKVQKEERLAGGQFNSEYDRAEKTAAVNFSRAGHTDYVKSLRRLDDAYKKVASGNLMANLLGVYDIALMNNQRVTDKDFEVALGITGLAEMIESSGNKNAKATLRMLNQAIERGDQDDVGILARSLRGVLTKLIPDDDNTSIYTESKQKQILEGLDVVRGELEARVDEAMDLAAEDIRNAPSKSIAEGRAAYYRKLFGGDFGAEMGLGGGGGTGGSGGAVRGGKSPEELKTLGANVPFDREAYDRADRRGRRFRDSVTAAARKHGVDPDLAYSVMLAESNGDPTAVNDRSGATGLFQILPVHDEVDFDRLTEDPEYAIDQGVRILKAHIDRAENTAASMTDWGGDTSRNGRYLQHVMRFVPPEVRERIGMGPSSPTPGDPAPGMSEEAPEPEEAPKAVEKMSSGELFKKLEEVRRRGGGD